MFEHRAVPIEGPEEQDVDLKVIEHPVIVTMTAACDLEQDFAARFPDQYDGFKDDAQRQKFIDQRDRYLLTHVLVCDALEEVDFKPGLAPGGELWKRVRTNQDQRYHHLGPAPVGQGGPTVDLYLDFKKVFALGLDTLYAGLVAGGITRVAVVPDVYVHDLVQRFYSYQARVGLPD